MIALLSVVAAWSLGTVACSVADLFLLLTKQRPHHLSDCLKALQAFVLEPLGKVAEKLLYPRRH